MQTEIIKVDAQNPEPEKVRQAAEILEKGGIVGFPTETVYGLAAKFDQQKAIERIYAIKRRPKHKPLPIQIYSVEYLEKLDVEIPVLGLQLMSKFWPGPLTLIFKKKQGGSIGIRIPAHPVALSLLRACEFPIVAPSANLSDGKPAVTSAQVLENFQGMIEAVIDGGTCDLKIASTVLDLSAQTPQILRPGALSQAELGI
jgi:L-threonylcarbamoyladenylate synthase